jgi:hypothetical protein
VRTLRAIVTLLLGAWALCLSPSLRGAPETYSADAVKAAFIYRFAGFVEWPDGALSAEHFTIAVLDDDELATQLEQLSRKGSIKKRPIQIHRLKSIRDLDDAQVLYLGPAHRGPLGALVANAAKRAVLIVTSEQSALDAGSMVNFMVVDQRVRFEISVDAAERSGLNVGSELLSVAIHVRGKRGAG